MGGGRGAGRVSAGNWGRSRWLNIFFRVEIPTQLRRGNAQGFFRTPQELQLCQIDIGGCLSFPELYAVNVALKVAFDPCVDSACADCPGLLVLCAAPAPASTFVSEPQIVLLG